MADPAMPAAVTLPPADPAVDAFAVLAPARRGWMQWVPPLISVALAIAIILALRDRGLAGFVQSVPHNPIFWVGLVGYYFALPLSEYVIYRRLWRLPFGGIVALLRKLVSNEILLGYSGEAIFYLWARNNSRLVAAPFGAIKDVSILSALAGNAMTLGMLSLSWQLLAELWPGGDAKPLLLSAGFIVLVSVGILSFRVRLFSLSRADLWFIFATHMLRLLTATLFYGLMLRGALPHLDTAWLIGLATMKLVVDRLPFVPTKELLFASIALFLVGGQVGVAVTIIGGALIASHIVIGMLLVGSDALRSLRT